MKSKVSFFAFYIFLFLSFLIVFSAYWVKDTFGQINFDSLLYHISTNLEGTSSNMIKSYFIGPFLKTIICMALIIILINLKYSYKLFFSFKIFKFKKNDIDIFNLLYKAKILISFINSNILKIYILILHL